ISQSLGKPYVMTPHGMLDPWSLRHSRWQKKLYLAVRLRSNLDRAALIHYTSSIERDLTGSLRLRPATVIVPNGVDLAEFANLPPRGIFRTRQGLPEHAPVVLFLGRVHPKK